MPDMLCICLKNKTDRKKCGKLLESANKSEKTGRKEEERSRDDKL